MEPRKAGRPKQEPRVRINIYVRDETKAKIDSMVIKKDDAKSSRGRIVDEKFNKPEIS